MHGKQPQEAKVVPQRSKALWDPEPERRARAHPLLRLQQVAGNRAVGRLLQASLEVGRPDDENEREADRVAEHVMRTPAPGST
jgi:hypothetical protein